MYNILKRQYNYFIRGVIRINESTKGIGPIGSKDL